MFLTTFKFMTHGIFLLLVERNNKMKRKTQTKYLLLAAAVLLLIPQAASAATPQWNLQINNLTGTTLTLTYDELLTLPKTTVYAELYCYGTPLTSGEWTGVKVAELLNLTGVGSARSVDFKAQDGYQVALPINTVTQPDVIVAYEKDGVPLNETLRLILPKENGNLWISMITTISLSSNNIDLGQSTPGIKPPVNPGIGSSIIQQQIQPTPTPQVKPPTPAPTATATPEPTTPPVNVTQPPIHQNLPDQTLAFPLELATAAALGAIIAVAAVSLVLYRRRKNVAQLYV